jgi:hypothetical protein
VKLVPPVGWLLLMVNVPDTRVGESTRTGVDCTVWLAEVQVMTQRYQEEAD